MAHEGLLWMGRANEAQPRRSLSGGPQAPCQTEDPKGETVHTTRLGIHSANLADRRSLCGNPADRRSRSPPEAHTSLTGLHMATLIAKYVGISLKRGHKSDPIPNMAYNQYLFKQ